MFHTTLNRVRHQRALREAAANSSSSDRPGSAAGGIADNVGEDSALASYGATDFDTEGTLKKLDKNANANPPVAIVNPTVKEVSQTKHSSDDQK